MTAATYEVGIEIGGMAIVVRTGSAEFARLLADHYGPFVIGAGSSSEASAGVPAAGDPPRPEQPVRGNALPDKSGSASFDFRISNFLLEVELLPPAIMSEAEEARVRLEAGRCFRASYSSPRTKNWCGWCSSPLSISSAGFRWND